MFKGLKYLRDLLRQMQSFLNSSTLWYVTLFEVCLNNFSLAIGEMVTGFIPHQHRLQLKHFQHSSNIIIYEFLFENRILVFSNAITFEIKLKFEAVAVASGWGMRIGWRRKKVTAPLKEMDCDRIQWVEWIWEIHPSIVWINACITLRPCKQQQLRHMSAPTSLYLRHREEVQPQQTVL